jgi:hypothetical protein
VFWRAWRDGDGPHQVASQDVRPLHGRDPGCCPLPIGDEAARDTPLIGRRASRFESRANASFRGTVHGSGWRGEHVREGAGMDPTVPLGGEPAHARRVVGAAAGARVCATEKLRLCVADVR